MLILNGLVWNDSTTKTFSSWKLLINTQIVDLKKSNYSKLIRWNFRVCNQYFASTQETCANNLYQVGHDSESEVRFFPSPHSFKIYDVLGKLQSCLNLKKNYCTWLYLCIIDDYNHIRWKKFEILAILQVGKGILNCDAME